MDELEKDKNPTNGTENDEAGIAAEQSEKVQGEAPETGTEPPEKADEAPKEATTEEFAADKEAAQSAEPSEEDESDGKGKETGHCRRELKKAREEIEKLKAEAEDFKRKWYSVTAEYENYRRRTQNQAAQRYTEGRSDVVSALFPVGDNLERALAACADDKTRQGVEMVLKSYKKILESEGVEELDPAGQAFDPAIAEAIMAVPAAEGEEAGVVKQVYVKGYKRGDKVLRYAQVIVTQ